MIIISLMILIIAIALTPYRVSGISYSSGSKEDISIQSEGGISPILLTRLTSIVFLFSGALAYNALHIQSIGSGLSLYSGLFQVTVLSQSIDIIIFILASLILIPWKKELFLVSNPLYTRVYYFLTGPVVSEYSLIVLFTTLGSSLLLSSGNLLSMYLAIELQSFGVYILATIYRNSESATNAGLKYFLLGGLSSCLILLGCVIIYSYTGVISFEEIYSLITSVLPYGHSGDTGLFSYAGHSALGGSIGTEGFNIITMVQLGLILIFIGFLFKIAAAPFHNWAPDVYNDTPTIVTTWLTIMPKIAIVIVSFEILSTINWDALNILVKENISTITHGSIEINPTGSLLKNLLLISSFLSLMIGTIVGLAQIKIKRLLAYSTISHVGFLLIALSINTEDSLESLIFYLIQYSFTNLNTFFILLSFGYIIHAHKAYKAYVGAHSSSAPNTGGPVGTAMNDISLISELKGQFQSNPLLSLSLAVCLFSMAGIPPLMGFFAKAQVLYSAIQNGYYFISIIAILVSVISAYYYLQIIRVLHFDSQPSSSSSDLLFKSEDLLSQNNKENAHSAQGGAVVIVPTMGINNTHSYIISILTLSLLLFMLKPSLILNSIHLMALNVFYS